MPSRLLHDLLLRSRDDVARARRWAWIGWLILIAVHGLGVSPFIERERERGDAAAEHRRLSDVDAGLRSVGERLEGAHDGAATFLESALAGLVAGVEADLARVDATRRQVRDIAPADAAPSEAEPFDVSGSDLAPRLLAARSRDALLLALRPAVERLAIEPRLETFQRRWRDSGLPPFERELDAVAAELAESRGRYPEGEAHWQGLADTVATLRRQVRDLEIRPPAEAFWWARSEAGEEVGVTLPEAIAERLLAPRSAVEIERYAVVAQAHLDTLATAVERDLAAAPPHGAAATVAGAISWALLAPWFVAFLGLTLGLLIALPGAPRRELAVACRRCLEEGAPPSVLIACDDQLDRSGTVVLITVLAAGWVALATWQAFLFGALPETLIEAQAITAGLALLIGAGWRLLTARGANELLDEPLPESAPSELAVTAEARPADAPLEAHTLR